MERRSFVKNTFVISGGIIVAPKTLLKSKTKKLTILHTNDTHSNIDAFPANHSKFPNKGGVVKRYELIEQIRKEQENVLLLDAGDIFQGTPYFNLFGGVLEMKVMSEMGYDAATMGNHDFDGGLHGFSNALQHAKFPILCTNYDFSETILKDKTQKSIIIKKGGLKIGIFGIGVELKGLVPEDKYDKTKYLNPIECANLEAEKLKKQNCDFIICLSHLGYSYTDDKISDLVLASKTKNIHLIIGGHTHTFLDKPTEIKNLSNETVIINQVGWGGVVLGRLDFNFEKETKYKHKHLDIENSK